VARTLQCELDNDTLARLSSAPFTLEESVLQLIEAAKEAGWSRQHYGVLSVRRGLGRVRADQAHDLLDHSPPVARAAAPAKSYAVSARRLSWRTPAALLIFIGVFVGAYFVVHWYAYSTYYLGSDTGTVAVYQGQPSGILWFKPIKVAGTELSGQCAA